jgi:hypothetical protein
MAEEIALFAEREEVAGRAFSYSEIDVAGYPFTLRGTLTDVRWQTDLFGEFEAEEVVIVTLPSDPSRIIFAPQGEKTLTLGETPYDLDAEDLRFSLEEDFAAMEGHVLSLRSGDSEITLGDIIVNRQRLNAEEAIAVSVRHLRLNGEDDVHVPFFDMAASRGPRSLTIAAADLAIQEPDDPSPTQLTAKGDLRSGQDNRLSGQVDVKFKNEGPLLAILGNAGAFDEDTLLTASSIIGMMTESGTKEVTLPLSLDDGRLRLGPVPLGAVPPISL